MKYKDRNRKRDREMKDNWRNKRKIEKWKKDREMKENGKILKES